HVDSKRAGSRHVYDEVNFDGLLDRQIRWLLALENAPGIDAKPAMRIQDIGTIAHQTASHRIFAKAEDRRDCTPERHCGQLLNAGEEKGIRADDEPTCPQLLHPCKDRIEVALAGGMQQVNLKPKGAGGGLQVSRLSLRKVRTGGIEHDGEAGRCRDHLMQEL